MAANTQPNTFNWDHFTVAFGTAIVEIAPPQANRRAKLTSLVYTAGATEHNLRVMKAINQVTLTAASAATDTTLDLSEATFAGDTLANLDWVIVEHADGTFGAYMATSLAALVLTISGGLSKAANSGARVWIMGAPGDTYHLSYKSGTSAEKSFSDPVGGLGESGYDAGAFFRQGTGDPIMFHSDNATAAGTLNRGAGVYV